MKNETLMDTQYPTYIVTYTNNIYSNREKVQDQKAEKLMIEDTGYVWEF